ncbi:hypothetical protein BDV95DRAFT_296238 [Massariosphaeria phaeospora]|uniref:Uncharacterized protein n=1 Tax=Massariosphaeria phaeospora TaxID=100035 RepID=A0A7C8M9N1_9PLEO|nr:hypothetical protein BDV95DRAFT_296238 [Massariosphaeria phaeospora]
MSLARPAYRRRSPSSASNRPVHPLLLRHRAGSGAGSVHAPSPSDALGCRLLLLPLPNAAVHDPDLHPDAAPAPRPPSFEVWLRGQHPPAPFSLPPRRHRHPTRRPSRGEQARGSRPGQLEAAHAAKSSLAAVDSNGHSPSTASPRQTTACRFVIVATRARRLVSAALTHICR